MMSPNQLEYCSAGHSPTMDSQYTLAYQMSPAQDT